MLNIYDGTLGMLSNMDKVEHELNKYISSTTDDLSYEVKEDKSRVVIITGKNEQEKELPIWGNPLIFKDVRGNDTVAIDLRPYMKAKLDDMIVVSDMLQDKYNGMMQMYRLVFTKLMLDDDISWLSSVNLFIEESFASIITTSTTMMTFDNSIADKVNVIAKLHYLTMDEEELSKIEDYIYRLPKQDINALIKGDLKDLGTALISKFRAGELMFPSRTIGSLVENIKVLLDTTRTDGLEPDLYLQTLSRSFYSMDSKSLSVGFIENKPTLFAILIMVTTEGINSKSSLRKILNSNKRACKPNETAKTLIEVYNDQILS